MGAVVTLALTLAVAVLLGLVWRQRRRRQHLQHSSPAPSPPLGFRLAAALPLLSRWLLRVPSRGVLDAWRQGRTAAAQTPRPLLHLPSHFRGPAVIELDGRQLSAALGRIYLLWDRFEPVAILADPPTIQRFYRDQYAHGRGEEMVMCGPVFSAVLGHCTATIDGGRERVRGVRNCYEHFFAHGFLEQEMTAHVRQAVTSTLDAMPVDRPLSFADMALSRIHQHVVGTLVYGQALARQHMPFLQRCMEEQRVLFAGAMMPTPELLAVAQDFHRRWLAFHTDLLDSPAPPDAGEAMFFHLAAAPPPDGRESPPQSSSPQPQPLALVEIVHTINEILLTNADVTALALGFLLQDLAAHPEVVARLRSGFAAGDADADADAHAAYLDGVVKESARLHPVVTYTFPERIVSELPLPDGACVLPPGTIVVLDGHSLSFDERMWPDPQRFQPERHLPRDIPVGQQKPVFLHFGLGPRRCQGWRLAGIISRDMIRQVLERFDLSPGPSPAAPRTNIPDPGMPFVTRELPTPVIFRPRKQ